MYLLIHVQAHLATCSGIQFLLVYLKFLIFWCVCLCICSLCTEKISEIVHCVKMGDPSKEKVLKEFTIILEEFLNQCERASVKSQHQNDSSVRKHNLAHEPHSKSKSASLMSETSKLEQMSSDSPSALCSDTERKHQKKSFFRRTRDRLLSTFRRQSTARKATSKQSSIESNKKSATKRLVQDKTFDQKDGYDRKLCAGQEIRKETSLNPATNEELNLHQIMSKSTRNPELGAGEQTETLHDRCNRYSVGVCFKHNKK